MFTLEPMCSAGCGFRLLHVFYFFALHCLQEEQRKRNREWRLQIEARVQERKALAMEKLGAESWTWVREWELERRIEEALDDPYRLHAK